MLAALVLLALTPPADSSDAWLGAKVKATLLFHQRA
jgi:hypothetical protein